MSIIEQALPTDIMQTWHLMLQIEPQKIIILKFNWPIVMEIIAISFKIQLQQMLYGEELTQTYSRSKPVLDQIQHLLSIGEKYMLQDDLYVFICIKLNQIIIDNFWIVEGDCRIKER